MASKIIEVQMARNFQTDSLKHNHFQLGDWKFNKAQKNQCQLMRNKDQSNSPKTINKDKSPVQLKIDSLETIDRAMDIQQILFEFSQIINSYYRFQLLIVILTAFIIIVFDCYYLLEVLNNPHQRI